MAVEECLLIARLGFAWRKARRAGIYEDPKLEVVRDLHCEALVRLGRRLRPKEDEGPIAAICSATRSAVTEATSLLAVLAGGTGTGLDDEFDQAASVFEVPSVKAFSWNPAAPAFVPSAAKEVACEDVDACDDAECDPQVVGIWERLVKVEGPDREQGASDDGGAAHHLCDVNIEQDPVHDKAKELHQRVRGAFRRFDDIVLERDASRCALYRDLGADHAYESSESEIDSELGELLEQYNLLVTRDDDSLIPMPDGRLAAVLD